MESSKKGTYISPAKIALNNKLEKFCHSTFNSEAQFKLLQSYETPPSKFFRTKNPFDSLIDEKLDSHFASPGIFSKVLSPKSEEGFRWDIDTLSSLNPAQIDHHTTDQFDTPERNPDVESFAQSRIEKFFSLKEIVPSPYTVAKVIELPLPQEELNPKPILTDNSAQTVLSLPPILPKHVEDVLKPYFTQTKSQEDGANSFLYRNLFEGEFSKCSDSDASSPAKSIDLNLSPIQYSPMNVGMTNRTSSTPTDDHLKTCDLSPVILKSKFRSKNYSQMSIDTSFTVPDENDVSNNMSLGLDNSKNSVEEKLSESTVHWSLEYDKIDSPDSEHQEYKMDVSHLNTPKLRTISSQRKKLSDSFPELDEDEQIAISQSIEGNNDCNNEDFSDPGYHTGCLTTEESSSWSTSHLFASTPTKQKVIRNEF